ncbi:hypothetical protein HMPREF7215_2387 [Pyramidobacter piscolens W5455]|uniref:Uncharacterized protein n=1 Tax=Pyramidobacter piscolens W5455 TaxID=352165 RepID=A0ABM9ZVK5_9BACT|nr:hypothetical protein HMPREF7215_2387 [Pyramidobacter piscolens W5455]
MVPIGGFLPLTGGAAFCKILMYFCLLPMKEVLSIGSE